MLSMWGKGGEYAREDMHDRIRDQSVASHFGYAGNRCASYGALVNRLQTVVCRNLMEEAETKLGLDQYAHGMSARNRLGRLLWKVVEGTLFRFSPAPAHGWRRALLRLFGATLSSSASVYPTARIWAPWNLEMGPHSCISWGVDCYCVDKIRLGAQTLVSQHARLIAASHDIGHPRFSLIHRPINLGSESWICAYAYVGMGVTVGQGAVVAATATVVKDVEPWTIVGGNPAKRIGTREIHNERDPG